MNKVAETKNYFSSSIYVCCYLIQTVVISKQTLTFNALTAMEKLTLCSSILLHFLGKLNWSNVLGKLEGSLCSICVCFCLNPKQGSTATRRTIPVVTRQVLHICYSRPSYKRVQRLLHICCTQGTWPWEYKHYDHQWPVERIEKC